MHLHESKPIIIAVVGTTHGCGVTHFCIELSIYLSKVCKKKVALIEINTNPSLGFLFDNNGKSSRNITYFKNGDKSTINYAMSEDFNYIILDIGTNICNYESEYTMSDMRIIILNLSKHWLSRTLSTYTTTPSLRSSATFLMYAFVIQYEARVVEKIFKKRVMKIPYEKELLRLEAPHISFYKSIF